MALLLLSLKALKPPKNQRAGVQVALSAIRQATLFTGAKLAPGSVRDTLLPAHVRQPPD